jgi:hypothetical protein
MRGTKAKEKREPTELKAPTPRIQSITLIDLMKAANVEQFDKALEAIVTISGGSAKAPVMPRFDVECTCLGSCGSLIGNAAMLCGVCGASYAIQTNMSDLASVKVRLTAMPSAAKKATGLYLPGARKQ